MNINLRPFLYPWVVLAVAVIVLLVRRKAVSRHEDDTLHVLDGGGADQPVVAHQLDQIDKWGKILTVIALVYGVILGAAYAYQAWIETSQSGV
jgi:ABC-type transport system involved in cytochrome c biogenesis permease subunit